MNIKLIQHTPNPEELVASAGKLCYSPVGVEDIQEELTDKEVDKFVDRVISTGHGSVLEHVSFSFGVEGISRITEVQLVRHRIGCSNSIQSGRYVNRDSPEFVIPPKIEECRPALERYSQIMVESTRAYNDLFLILMLSGMGYGDAEIDKMSEGERVEFVDHLFKVDYKKYKQLEKECIEDARYAHLQSLCTKLVVTMNARALMNFFSLRCCKRAQWEIMAMANEMLKQVQTVAPALFKTAGAGCVRGGCPEGKMSCGEPFARLSNGER